MMSDEHMLMIDLVKDVMLVDPADLVSFHPHIITDIKTIEKGGTGGEEVKIGVGGEAGEGGEGGEEEK